MRTVNVWGAAGGIGEMRSQSLGKIGKNLYPNFVEPLLWTFDRRSCNDGGREFIPIFHNPHRKAVTGSLVKIKNGEKLSMPIKKKQCVQLFWNYLVSIRALMPHYRGVTLYSQFFLKPLSNKNRRRDLFYLELRLMRSHFKTVAWQEKKSRSQSDRSAGLLKTGTVCLSQSHR